MSALRMAFNKCSGKFITRMDSDDIMVENHFEIMIKSLQKHDKQHLAIGQVQYFRKDGVSYSYACYACWLNGLTKLGNCFYEV